MSVNQQFGANPDYYAKLIDAYGNPEKGHMGVDFFAPHATPLYAPCDGEAWYAQDEHGGDGIYIRTGPFDYNEGQVWFNIILMAETSIGPTNLFISFTRRRYFPIVSSANFLPVQSAISRSPASAMSIFSGNSSGSSARRTSSPISQLVVSRDFLILRPFFVPKTQTGHLQRRYASER